MFAGGLGLAVTVLGLFAPTEQRWSYSEGDDDDDSDAAARIRDLNALLAENLITQDQFDAKQAEIIAEL